MPWFAPTRPGSTEKTAITIGIHPHHPEKPPQPITHTMSAGPWKEMFNAACEGDLAPVEYHVQTGVADNYATPEFRSTPLVAAVLAKQEQVALYLLAHGANPELPSEFDGVTPSQAAHRVGLGNVVAQLHQLGVAHPPEPTAPTGWLEKWLAAKAKQWNKAWATKP